ncbi:MAG: EamA family transporter [Bacteroidales bacterium]|nr:EamA family transporter [Bacteroidales bacterium]
MTQNKRFFGTLCGILAAVCYGTNPLGALKLYGEGMSTPCVLFYRFSLAWLIIVAVLCFRRESIQVSRRELRTLLGLGSLFAISSLTLYLSFHLMAAGVASTILFIYPVLTAIIMAIFFKERAGITTWLSILLSMVGVALLYWTGGEGHLSPLGVALVIASALSYALYIIVVDRSELNMSPFKINFYVLACCALVMLGYALVTGSNMSLPHSATAWFFVGWLAVVPAIMALVLMVYAAKYIGSTATAILGALEPLTAVLIGIFCFGEAFSLQLALGIILILAAVVFIAARKNKQ